MDWSEQRTQNNECTLKGRALLRSDNKESDGTEKDMESVSEPVPR